MHADFIELVLLCRPVLCSRLIVTQWIIIDPRANWLCLRSQYCAQVSKECFVVLPQFIFIL